MSLTRILGHALLVLALIANGLVSGGMAMAGTHAQHEAAAVLPTTDPSSSGHGSCHDQTKAPAIEEYAPGGQPMTCCDGGDCACSCMQHAPAALLAFAMPGMERFAPMLVLGQLISLPSAPSTPQFRPPIF